METFQPVQKIIKTNFVCSCLRIVLCILTFEKFPSGQYGLVNGKTCHVPYRLIQYLQNNKLFLVIRKLWCLSLFFLKNQFLPNHD